MICPQRFSIVYPVKDEIGPYEDQQEMDCRWRRNPYQRRFFMDRVPEFETAGNFGRHPGRKLYLVGAGDGHISHLHGFDRMALAIFTERHQTRSAGLSNPASDDRLYGQ